MTCYTCHLSWTTSCAGCHLPIQANAKTDRLHYEGGETRNYATYNPQVARDDMFQLGHHGPVKGSKIAPDTLELGAGAVVDQHQPRAHLHPAAADRRVGVLARRRSRRTIRTPSARPRPRPAATATSRSKTTTTRSWRSSCCRGPTSSTSSATTRGSARRSSVAAVQVTEWDEPQAVIGSYLHQYAYPDWFAQHQKRELRLPTDRRRTTPRAPRAACNCAASTCTLPKVAGGMRVYDVASIANKGDLAEDHHRAVFAAGDRTRTSPRRTRPASRCRPTSRSTRCATRAS